MSLHNLTVPGSSEKRLTGKGGKLNTSQAEPVAANSPFDYREVKDEIVHRVAVKKRS